MNPLNQPYDQINISLPDSYLDESLPITIVDNDILTSQQKIILLDIISRKRLFHEIFESKNISCIAKMELSNLFDI